MTHRIAAGKFKTECLKIMDEVQRTRQSVVITKHNIPIVRLVPLEKKRRSLFGCIKDSVEFIGDVTAPIEEAWDAGR